MEIGTATHAGASAYSTPIFEPASVVASAPTFFQRVAAWLTWPVFTLDLESLGENEFDPGEHMRESMRQSSDEMLDIRIGSMNTAPDND